MAIDALTETLRSFAEAAQRLPALRGGKPVNPSTLWRWTTRGVRARHGVLVRLETIKLGGTCCTSDQALVRFFQALTDGASQSEGTRIPCTTPSTAPDANQVAPGGAPGLDKIGEPDGSGTVPLRSRTSGAVPSATPELLRSEGRQESSAGLPK
jgi:hypothetical protein